MNQAYDDLIKAHGNPRVPLIGHFQNLYELVQANYDWMFDGNGEGIVIIGLG